MKITRRTLLAAAAGSTFAIDWFSPTGFTAEQAMPAAIREWSALRFFNGDFSNEQVLQYPRLLELSASKKPTEISLRYDPRLFMPAETVQFSRDKKTAAASARFSQLEDGRGQLAFTLPAGSGQASLSLPLRRRTLYPLDNIDGLLPMDMTLAPGGGPRGAYRWGKDLESTPVIAWGAELRAGWKRVLGTRARDSYSLPQFVRVLSVGDHPRVC